MLRKRASRRRIIEQTAGIDKDKINAKMERFESSRTPPEDVDEFERATLRARYPVIFDLLEADDERLYARAFGDRDEGVAAPSPV